MGFAVPETTAPQSTSSAVPPPEDDDRFVPVEQRLLGLDRRTIPLSLVVVALVLLTVVVLPAVTRSLQSPDLVDAGDRVVLVGPDALTVTPPVGWDLVDGVRVGETAFVALPSRVVLAHGGIRVAIETAEFDGSPDELMDRVGERNARQDDLLDVGSVKTRAPVTLADGTPGVAEVYTGLDRKAVVLTFVLDADDGRQVGVAITAVGSAEDLDDDLLALSDMADSLTAPTANEEAP